MQYGDEYGELIGDAISEIETHVEDGIDFLPYALDNAVDFRKMLTIFLEKIQEIENAIRGVTPALLFDIPTAYGRQLDQLGSILGCPRQGWDDELYRVYLRTQSLLILPDRRTQGKLMEVIRSLMDTDAGTIGYVEFRPKTYLLSVGLPGLTLETLAFWNIRFLERCRPATYNTLLIFNPVDAFGYDDATMTITTTVFAHSDATDTIDVGGPYSSIVPLP